MYIIKISIQVTPGVDFLLTSSIFFSIFAYFSSTSSDETPIKFYISIQFSSNFQEMFKTKFGSLKNCGRPSVCRNFLLQTFLSRGGGVVFTPPPSEIGLNIWFNKVVHGFSCELTHFNKNYSFFFSRIYSGFVSIESTSQ